MGTILDSQTKLSIFFILYIKSSVFLQKLLSKFILIIIMKKFLLQDPAVFLASAPSLIQPTNTLELERLVSGAEAYFEIIIWPCQVLKLTQCFIEDSHQNIKLRFFSVPCLKTKFS